MRRPESILLLGGLVLLGLTACNRLTFIKPDYSKYKIEQVRHVPDVRDTAQSRARMQSSDALQIASERMRQGDYPAAEKAAKRALASDKTNLTALTIMALVEQQRGNSAQAGGWYRQAAEQQASGPAEWGNYGSWMCESNRLAEGIAWLDRALAQPDSINVAGMRANAGRCALDLGQTARAETDLRTALQLDPTNVVGLESMAQLMFARSQLLEARAFSERRLGAAPATPAVLARAAMIETRLGDTVAANRYTQRLKQEFPNATPNVKGL